MEMEDFQLFRVRGDRLVTVRLPASVTNLPPIADWFDPIWMGDKDCAELVWVDGESSEMFSLRLSAPATGRLDLPAKIVRITRARTLLVKHLYNDARLMAGLDGSDGRRYLVGLVWCEQEGCQSDHILRVSSLGELVSADEQNGSLTGAIVMEVTLPGESASRRV